MSNSGEVISSSLGVTVEPVDSVLFSNASRNLINKMLIQARAWMFDVDGLLEVLQLFAKLLRTSRFQGDLIVLPTLRLLNVCTTSKYFSARYAFRKNDAGTSLEEEPFHWQKVPELTKK